MRRATISAAQPFPGAAMQLLHLLRIRTPYIVTAALGARLEARFCRPLNWGWSMRPRYHVLCALVLATSGCGLAQQMGVNEQARLAHEQLAKDKAECEKLYPNKYAKPATPRVECFAEANLKYHETIDAKLGDPNLDLAIAMNDKAKAAAKKYDTGKLSKAQFDVAKAKAYSDYNDGMMQGQKYVPVVDVAESQEAKAARTGGPEVCTTADNTATCY